MAQQWDKDTSLVGDGETQQEARAVAIKYDVKNDKAPRVTAKGRSYVADRILAEARKNGIPVYQNKSLVNMLMALEIDREIPPSSIARSQRYSCMSIGLIAMRGSVDHHE